ncbi:MAG: MFS transporter, partial [Micromonosporaceae bacterium]
MSDPATTAESQPMMLRRSIMASLVGTSLEWYDFFLYGAAAALVFNSQFFPSYDPLTGTLLAFATYAVGFIARPIGGVVAGHYGDRFGRKNVLVATLLIMGGATFLIGLMPTYNQIGVAAPIALVVLRLAQGIGLGGEWAGGALIIAERSPTARRGYLTSFVQVGVPVGSLLSTLVLLVMGSMLSDAAFNSWGWRVPFLLSAVIMLVGFYIRKRLNETPLYQKTAEEAPAKKRTPPVLEVLRHQSHDVGRVIGIRIGADILYYTMVTFLITYVTETLGMDKGVALRATVIAAIMQLAAYPAFAALSDRIGRRPVTMFGAIGALVWIMLFFALLDTKSPALITVAVVGGLFFHGAMYGV